MWMVCDIPAYSTRHHSIQLSSRLSSSAFHQCLFIQCFDAVGWVAGRAFCLGKNEWWGASLVICLERGADLHMVKLMPLPLAVSCFSKIQIDFTFLVPAHPGSPGQRVVKWVLLLLFFSAVMHQH